MGARFVISRSRMSSAPFETFRVEPKDAFQFFSRPGEHFYIPAYQRQFAWRSNGDVKRLFTDVVEGIRELAEDDGKNAAPGIIFLGALILVEDRDRVQIHPAVQTQLPASVCVVIDGQQRSTSILVWACALRDLLGVHARIAAPFLERPQMRDLADLCDKTQSALEGMIHADYGSGDSDYRHYPRMIRSHEDMWSSRGEARYVSPIGRFLRAFSVWINSGASNVFQYQTTGMGQIPAVHAADI